MSTKVYAGYKVRLAKLGHAIDWFRISMWKRVVAVAGPNIDSVDRAREWAREYGECGFHVWIDTETDEALICLFGMPVFTEPKRTRPHWRFPAWIREFSYWNNSDPPPGMRKGAGYRRWEKRGKQWDRVALDGNRWEARLTQVVLSSGQSDFSLAMECCRKLRAMWPEIRLLSNQRLPR